MDIQELNKISPLRVFDDAINGGLGKGNLGVIVSRHGVGKTACLVHLATDKLLRGENVIHVSFSGNVEHVMNWYKEVFKEIAELQSLDDAHNVYASILSNRVVMNFSQSQISIEKVLSSLKSLIEQGAFAADAILFFFFKLTIADEDDIVKIREFAKEMNLEVWFSVSPVNPEVEYDEYGVPETLQKYYPYIDVLVGLRYQDSIDKVLMTVVRAHGKDVSKPMQVRLDPKTMLISH